MEQKSGAPGRERMNAKRQAFSQLRGTAASWTQASRQTKWWCRQATTALYRPWKAHHHHHQHSHAAWSLIKKYCTDQINTTDKLPNEATCFALITFISSPLSSVKMSSWWKIYLNLLRFSLQKWHKQALVSRRKVPLKSDGPEWAPVHDFLNTRPVMYVDFQQQTWNNVSWKQTLNREKSNLNA